MISTKLREKHIIISSVKTKAFENRNDQPTFPCKVLMQFSKRITFFGLNLLLTCQAGDFDAFLHDIVLESTTPSLAPLALARD